MHAFEHQNSEQTLAEGVAEYFRLNPGLTQSRGTSQMAQEFFRCHDTVHVVYGCNTSLHHEAIVKLSSIFGTTGGFNILKGYQLHESRQIYKELSGSEVFFTALQSACFVPRTIVRCIRQPKRWPWSNFQEYLQTPLQEIRREFGIQVARIAANEPCA